MAACRPMIHVSYPAILLVLLKFNLVVNGQYSPSGDIKIAPIPWPKMLDAPSKYSFHVSCLVDSSSTWKIVMRSSSGNSNFMGLYSSSVRSAKNSAMAFHLIAF